MSESISRPWMKHLIAGVIFLVLAALYCSPELFGKKINAHDSVSAVAAAKASTSASYGISNTACSATTTTTTSN